MKKSLSSALFVGVAAALVLAGAPAANADAPVALPSGQALYAIDCDEFAFQLWSLTPTGAGTPIGTAPANTSDCAGGAQVSPVDGLAYFITYTGVNDGLATINLTTGVVTPIAPISGATTGAWQLMITNSGAAFITNGQDLYSISLTTGVTTLIGNIAPANIGTMGYDPTTDTIYAFSYSDTVEVWTIDRTTGVGTDTGLTGTWPDGSCLDGSTDSARPDAVVFDSAGFAWIESDTCEASIMTVDMTTGDAAMLGQIFDATGTRYTTAPNEFYSETFIIGPAAAPAAAPGLAATGIDTTAVTIAGGIGVIAALAGAALVVRSRRRTA